jgi:hypothetical protein
MTKIPNEQTPSVQFVDSLPTVNYTSSFLIKKERFFTVVEDYLSFLDFFISEIANKGLGASMFDSYRTKYEAGSMHFTDLPPSLRESILLSGEAAVCKLEKVSDKDGIAFKYSQNLDYEAMIHIYSKTTRGKGVKKTARVTPRYMLDWYFLWLWDRGELLFPNAVLSYGKFTRNYANNDYFFSSRELYQMFKRETEHRVKESPSKYGETARAASILTLIMSCASWRKSDDIVEEDLSKIQDLAEKNSMDNDRRGVYVSRVINAIRWALLSTGREDITNPAAVKGAKISRTKGSNAKEYFLNLDTTTRPNLEQIKASALLFIEKLSLDGLAVSTINNMAHRLKKFVSYIAEEYPGAIYDESFFEKLFAKFVLDKGADKLGPEAESRSAIIGAARFLIFAGLFPPAAMKYIPQHAKKTVSARQAMPKHMIRHLRDILVNRPPITKTIKWSPAKADLSWWAHKDVCPIFPLMLLFHLYVPLRGEQVRHLCRKNSIVLNEDGNIEAFVINTDKNVNRKELPVIPNVWEDLNIFKDFLKWHYECFPVVPKVKYHDDENTPWQDIEPLMIMPHTLLPVNYAAHKAYMYLLMAKYQIEANNERISKGLEPTISVIRFKDGRSFPTDFSEIEKLGFGEINQYLTCSYDIHSFRVTGATRYLQEGLGLNLVMLMTGHMNANTLTNIYIKLTNEEKVEAMSSAVSKLFFGREENLVETVNKFVLGEIPANYDTDNPEDLKRALDDNGLFSLIRKNGFENSKHENMEIGTDIAINKHPSEWFAMIHGICPGVKCPVGRERKCSLCPYLITGRLFLEGLVHQANIALAKMHKLAGEIEKDEKRGYENQAKNEEFEIAVEEVIGWNEIIQKIEDKISGAESSNLPITTQGSQKRGSKKLIEAKQLPTALAHLENCYKASRIGVEQDSYSTAIVTIAAYNYAINTKDTAALAKIASDEKFMVDYLMGYYQKAKSTNHLQNFIKMLNGFTKDSSNKEISISI